METAVQNAENAPEQDDMNDVGAVGAPYKKLFGSTPQPELSTFVASSTGSKLAVYRWNAKYVGVANQAAKTAGQVAGAAASTAHKVMNSVANVAGGLPVPFGLAAKVEEVKESVSAKVDLAKNRVADKVDDVRTSKGTIVLVHGFAEHLGRYCHVAGFFRDKGFDVVGIDHVGHGRSQGSGGYLLPPIDDLVSDWSEFILAEVAPTGGRHFVYAHSTGATVALLSLQGGLRAKWERFQGVTFSGPLVRQAGCAGACGSSCAPCILGCLSCPCCGDACLSARCFPAVGPGQLSVFQKFEDATRKDDLYWGWMANLSVLRALLGGAYRAQQMLGTVDYPFLILQAEHDTLVDHTWSRKLYDQAPSVTKKWECAVFNACAHELHNHEDWEKPLKVALPWFESLQTDTVGAATPART